MGDLTKALGRFLTRDVFSILSGLYLLAGFADVILVQPNFASFFGSDNDVVRAILLLGTALVVGFANKEIFAFVRITVEAHYFTPWRIDEGLYFLHQREEWVQPKKSDHEHAYANIAKAGADVQSRYDRISDVIHIFSSSGASLMVYGVLMTIAHCRESLDTDAIHATGLYGVIMAIAHCRAALLVILGWVLITMSRFQAMRRMRFLSKFA